MVTGLLLLSLLALPALLAAVCLRLPSPRSVQAVVTGGVAAVGAVGLALAWTVFAGGAVTAASGWFFLDALSAYHLVVMMLVFLLSSVFAGGYFRGSEALAPPLSRRYGALWFGSLAAMMLVLISNNLGLMWVGIEATTLLTAFLICIHRTPTSLEATWKYLLICSVGIAFAFMGTLLVAASSSRLHLSPVDALLWTRLAESAAQLDPGTLRIGFLFLLVGYGTKSGLAPMHSWLPDAHSQAPAPVSAIFSGFMLSTALYCLMRYLPLVESATGHSGWGPDLLVLFGLVSIVVAASFIVFQRDLKRLLAYSSVEHMGIVALGLGLGGIGTFAALFHTLNHALGKTLAFYSAGRLGQAYGTHDMSCMTGAVRVSRAWGGMLLASILALLGAAPFAFFMSEFQVLKAAADRGSAWTLALYLGGLGVVFIGALRHAIGVAWGEPPATARAERPRRVEVAIGLAQLAALLALGVWMPEFLERVLVQAAGVIGGGIIGGEP